MCVRSASGSMCLVALAWLRARDEPVPSSLICTIAFLTVAASSLSASTRAGSSKMPQGTWQWLRTAPARTRGASDGTCEFAARAYTSDHASSDPLQGVGVKRTAATRRLRLSMSASLALGRSTHKRHVDPAAGDVARLLGAPRGSSAALAWRAWAGAKGAEHRGSSATTCQSAKRRGRLSTLHVLPEAALGAARVRRLHVCELLRPGVPASAPRSGA